MGLDDKATQFLLAARQLGVSFERTATIGIQRLYVTPSGLAKRLSAFGITTTSDTAKHLLNEEQAIANPFSDSWERYIQSRLMHQTMRVPRVLSI